MSPSEMLEQRIIFYIFSFLLKIVYFVATIKRIKSKQCNTFPDISWNEMVFNHQHRTEYTLIKAWNESAADIHPPEADNCVLQS